MKEDYCFNRLSRRGKTGVEIDIYGAVIGFNIRKYHKAKLKKEAEKEETAIMN